MAYQNRTKPKSSREEPALQLTSYQLVMAICALLLAGCLLFVAGILVNRVTGVADKPLVANLDSTPEDITPLGRQEDNSDRQTEGVQVSPNPVKLPPEPPVTTPGSTTTKPPVVRDTSSKYIPAPPPRRASSDESAAPAPSQPGAAATPGSQQVPKASDPVKPVVTPVVTEETPPAAPAKVGGGAPGSATSTEGGAPESPAPVASGEVSTPAPDKTPDTASPTTGTPAAAAPKAPFTIQVAAFDADNLDRAKQFKKSIEDKTDYTVDLVPSTDGKRVRAFIGSYPDRAAADKAKATLAKIKDFEGCFVKSLAE